MQKTSLKSVVLASTFLICTLLTGFFAQVSAHPNWDKSSLHFEPGCTVTGCESVKATICAHTNPMLGETSYELYYIAQGNPKNGTIVATGTVPALGSFECTTLTYPLTKPGRYMFKAYQREGHPGNGVLWSGACNVNVCAAPTPAPSITPTPTPSVTPSVTPSPSASVSPSVAPTPSATPEASTTPTPIPTPSDLPQASASPEPSVAPSATPAPSETPAVGGPTTPTAEGRKTSLANDNLQCTQTTFDAVMDVTDNGTAVEGKVVTFVYNGVTKQGTTDKNGRARVNFDQNGNGTVYASVDGFPSQSMSVTMPTCEASAQVTTTKKIAAITPRTAGQVLGATTLASTGHQALYVALTTFFAGAALTTGATYGVIQTKKI